MWCPVTMVAKFLDPNNFSQQRWPFVLANNGRKVKAIVHKKVMHVDSLVFPAIFAGPKFVEIQRFWYHGNVTWWLFLSISFNWKKGFCFFLLALDIYTCAYYTTNKVHESYLQLPLLDLAFILESNINAVRNLLLWNPLAVQICHSLVLSSLTFCP